MMFQGKQKVLQGKAIGPSKTPLDKLRRLDFSQDRATLYERKARPTAA